MNFMPIYSTPLWQSEYPNFEEDKDKFLGVKQFKEQNPSTETRSSIAGYQSPKNLQTVFELSHFGNIFVRWHIKHLLISIFLIIVMLHSLKHG